MTLDSIVVREKSRELETPKRMNWLLAEEWADRIRPESKNDPEHPEWDATPTRRVDLSREGYGVVHVKDEGSNPTGTAKDRPALEYHLLFGDFARNLFAQRREGLLNGNISEVKVPRFSTISAGNQARAVARRFEESGLPPIKVLLDKDTSQKRIEALKEEHADIYLTDLGARALSPTDILTLTNNEDGVDITSTTSLEPHARLYDWHVHEAFGVGADNIYMPVGSQRLFENYITWQQRTFRNGEKNIDPRLEATSVSPAQVTAMNIMGSTSRDADTIADKLGADFKPFIVYDEDDVRAGRRMKMTGKDTGIYRVSEQRLNQAYVLLSQEGFDTSPSGAAGLALYLQRFDEGEIEQGDEHLIINSGKGLIDGKFARRN